jgi:hypothetical protein
LSRDPTQSGKALPILPPFLFLRSARPISDGDSGGGAPLLAAHPPRRRRVPLPAPRPAHLLPAHPLLRAWDREVRAGGEGGGGLRAALQGVVSVVDPNLLMILGFISAVCFVRCSMRNQMQFTGLV